MGWPDHQVSIAVVGLSCRLPGGTDTPERFWEILEQGRDCIGEVPAERWNHAAYAHPHPDAPGHTPATQGGFLSSVFDFDASFFGISPREAESMDPQQRLLLELSYEALESAGLSMQSLAGSRTGVFVGLSSYDVVPLQAPNFGWATHAATGASPALCSNRISYFFDLRGPSLTLDSACSASLSALDTACRSLCTGQCDLALVGSVNLLLDPGFFLAFSRLHMLSPSNRCRVFDHSADGYVRAEGAVVMVLKRLDQAMRDEDRVEALILATALNQDGRSSGITVPNGRAQEALLRQLYAIHPPWLRQLAYLEAHGTGTPVGDPIEATSLARVFRPEGASEDRPLWVGSAKSNLGHLEGAAGAVGVLKAILCLQNGKIPPSLHFVRPPQELDLAGMGLAVPTTLQELPQGALVGVNSFGFGGSNGHALLAPAPQAKKVELGASPEFCLLPLSAASPEALVARVEQLLERLEQQTLGDLAYTLACRSTHHGYRLALAAGPGHDLRPALENWLREPTVQRATSQAQLVMVFSGQGPQWWGMGRELLDREPVFRSVVEACDRQIRDLGGWSLLDIWREPAESSRLNQTLYAQPALFALQVALVELARSLGIRPTAVVGHSVGEVAAAYTAGVLTLEQATEVIFHRASTMQMASMEGAMLAVQGQAAEIAGWLTPWQGRLEIGAINAPQSVVISGQAEAVEEFARWAADHEIVCRPVPVQYAFHSALVDPVRQPLEERLRQLRPSASRLTMVSSVTARPVEGEQLTAEYWWQNVRQPVRFAEAMAVLIDQGHRLFWELGPHPVLTPDCLACAELTGACIQMVPSLRRHSHQQQGFLQSLGSLWSWGLDLDWKALSPKGRWLRLPAYPWQRQTFGCAARERRVELRAQRPFPLLGRRKDHCLPTWQGVADGRVFPFLLDHCLQGRPLISASTTLELGLEMGWMAEASEEALVLRDLRWEQPGYLDLEEPLRLQSCLDLARGAFTVAALQGDSWKVLSRGRLQRQCLSPPPSPECFWQGWPRLDVDGLAERWQFAYGPGFRTIRQAWSHQGAVVCQLDWPDDPAWLVHPAGLDAAIRAILALVEPAAWRLAFPAEVEEVRFFARPGGRVWAQSQLIEVGPREWMSELSLWGDEHLFLQLRGLRWKLVPAPGSAAEPDLLGLDWVEIQQADLARSVTGQVAGPGASALPLQLPVGSELRVFVADSSDPVEQMDLLLQFLRQHEEAASPPRYVLVTRGAQCLSGDSTVCLDQAPLLGFWRAVQLEYPRYRALMVDLPPSPGAPELALLGDCLGQTSESELAIRRGKLFAPRWNTTSLEELDRQSFGPARPGQVYSAVADAGGGLEHLAWRQKTLLAPGPGQVVLQVEASGLNFSDLMKALRLYPGSSPLGGELGLECAGVVVQTGPGVERPRVGDRVVALGWGLLANRAVAEADLTAPWPSHLSPGQAAALGLASVTAWLALERLARLGAGERLLIHSATGGVGLAALAFARDLGAEVLATAGSPERRQRLRDLGVQRVYDSRRQDFADQVRRDTAGEGVDVVLNSLAGPGLEASLACLAPLGRMVEIGKRDIYDNRLLALHPFRASLSFLSLDLEIWMRKRKPVVGEFLARVLERGQPLPTECWPAAQLDQAMQKLAGSHYGKLVVTHPLPSPSQEGETEVTHPLPSPSQEGETLVGASQESVFDGSGVFVVSGGLGGLGLELADWLVGRGARRLLLIGRRGLATPGAAERLSRLEGLGVELEVRAADVAELENLPQDVGGVFHAANQMDDGILRNLDRSRLERVFQAKARGAWRLHQLTEARDVRYFVLFSSISSAFGAAGQANYCAANAFLDALAHYRRQRGLAAQVIHWGPVGDCGYLSSRPELLVSMQSQGHHPLRVQSCWHLLGRLLNLAPLQLAVAGADWWRLPRSARLQNLQGERRAEAAGSARPQEILTFLKEQAGRILRLQEAARDCHRSLRELGLDSLLAVEFRNSVEKHFQVILPMSEILSGPSLYQLAEFISGRLQADPPQAEDLPHLSDHEVRQLLLQLESQDAESGRAGIPGHGPKPSV